MDLARRLEMKTIEVKSKKGSKIKLSIMDLRGKDYMPVAQRLVWFREDNGQELSITTDLVEFNESHAICRASILKDGVVLSTGTKREDKKDFNDYIEKAETGSIGRALAHLGYGTQFAPELDEEHRIVDTPQPKKQAISPVKKESKPETPINDQLITDVYIATLQKAAKDNKLTGPAVTKLIKDNFKKSTAKELTKIEAMRLLTLMRMNGDENGTSK